MTNDAPQSCPTKDNPFKDPPPPENPTGGELFRDPPFQGSPPREVPPENVASGNVSSEAMPSTTTPAGGTPSTATPARDRRPEGRFKKWILFLAKTALVLVGVLVLAVGFLLIAQPSVVQNCGDSVKNGWQNFQVRLPFRGTSQSSEDEKWKKYKALFFDSQEGISKDRLKEAFDDLMLDIGEKQCDRLEDYLEDVDYMEEVEEVC
ncbi:MAG: hypothetical protein Q4D38_13420 [Planctomycetia bacterium]|nr:hypothetical protein [Planctomycetia bacterium]